MVVTQSNFVIKDTPGDSIEIIYVTGLAIAANGSIIQAVSVNRAGRIKAVVATCMKSTNAIKFNLLVLNSLNGLINYGDILASAGVNLEVVNLDGATAETNLTVCLIIYGG